MHILLQFLRLASECVFVCVKVEGKVLRCVAQILTRVCIWSGVLTRLLFKAELAVLVCLSCFLCECMCVCVWKEKRVEIH